MGEDKRVTSTGWNTYHCIMSSISDFPMNSWTITYCDIDNILSPNLS